MGDKLTAGLIAAVVIAPLCAVCILGPVALGLAFAGIVGWLGGFNLWIMVLAVAGAAALVYGLVRGRRFTARANVKNQDAG